MTSSDDMELLGEQPDAIVQVQLSAATQSTIHRVLRARMPRLRICYESSLRARPDLEGRWRLRVTVGTDGRPSNARLRGMDVSDPAMEACMAKRVETWSFGPLEQVAPVEEVLTFRM